MAQVDIVIVNWNTDILLKGCLTSILNNKTENIGSIIVIDNNSSDDSCQNLAKHESLKVVYADQNHGFGKACNIGAKYSTAPFILFLNPDTVLEKNSIEGALDFMNLEQSKDVGICGIQLCDIEGKVSHSCSRFPSVLNQFIGTIGLNKIVPSLGAKMLEFSHSVSMEVDQIMGAFFLIRRDLFIENNGFDEQFFVYFEEVDLSKRINLQGFKSYFLSDVRALHVGGGSSDKIKARRLFYSLRSRILYFKKHTSFFGLTLLVVCTVFLEPLTRILNCAIHLSMRQFIQTVGAYFLLWSWLLGIKNIIKA